jgi:hypothetical protein
MQARWYDPTTGQFLTPDPLEPLTGQPYSYANDNPINNTDPSGLDPLIGGGCAVGEAIDPLGGCAPGAAAGAIATGVAAGAGWLLGIISDSNGGGAATAAAAAGPQYPACPGAFQNPFGAIVGGSVLFAQWKPSFKPVPGNTAKEMWPRLGPAGQARYGDEHTLGGAIHDAIMGEILDELAVRGSDDWVMLTEVDASVRKAAARHHIALSLDRRIAVGLEVLRRALECGLMIAGDVVDRAPGFVRWDLGLPATLERIGREWNATGADLQMGDIAWLANTPAGETRAEDALGRVNARDGWRDAT